MQTLKSIKTLINGVKFNDWDFNIKEKNDIPYLQITFMAKGSFDGIMRIQHCRKWQLSFYMCDEEIISTAFKAMLAAVEHEAREQFFWEGQAIYRPHLDIRALHKMSEQNLVDKRDNTVHDMVPEDDARPEAPRFERSGYDTMGADYR